MKGGNDGPVEASALSRSRSASSTSKKNLSQIAAARGGFFDKIFPLIDEIYKKTLIPRGTYFLMVAYFSLQTIVVSMCPAVPAMQHFDGIAGKFTHVLFQICLVSDMTGSDSSVINSFIFFAVLAAIFLFDLIMQSVIHRKYLIFFTWSLYLSRVIFEFIPMMFLVPMGNYLGIIFQEIVQSASIKNILIGIFSVLIFVMFMFALFVSAYFGAKSTYIPNTIIACWDGNVFFIPPAMFPIFCMLMYVITYFNSYMIYFILGAKILMEVYVIYKLNFFPFITDWMNAFFCPYFLGLISLDVIYMLQIKLLSINYLIQYCTFFGVVALTMGFSFLYFNLRRKKVIRNLTYNAVTEYIESLDEYEYPDGYDPNRPPNYDAISEYYFHLGIDKSISRAKMYLQVGIAERSQLFLDWSLMKFIAEYQTSPEIKCEIAHMISFFPSESRLLSFYLEKVLEIPHLNYEERFMIYELDKIRKIRQSSASNEVTKKLLELKAMMQTSYSEITAFFTRSNSRIDDLYQLREQTERTESLYKEAITNWPNNVRICEDYAKFLIECATDFTEGVKMKNRANLIEVGKNFVVDICFKSMIRCYPQYLRKNVLDVKGRFIHHNINPNSSVKNSGSISSTSGSGMGSNMSTGTIDGELDIEVEYQIAKSSFSFHKLRLALQRCLATRKSKYTRILKILHSAALVLLVGIALFLYIYLYNEFDERAQNMDRQLQLNRFRYGYDAAFGSMIVYWTQNLGYVDPALFEDMKQRGPLNEYSIDLNEPPLDQISWWIDFSRDNIYEFIVEMVQLAIKGADIGTTYSPMIHKVVECHYCNGGSLIDYSVNESLRNAFVYLLFNMNSLILDADTDDWAKSDFMCQVLQNSPSIISGCRSLAIAIANDQERQKRETDKQLNLIVIILTIAYFLLVVPTLSYNYYMSFREIEYLISIISKTDDSFKQEALKSITRDSAFEETSMASNKVNSHINKWAFVFIVLLVLLVGLADIIAVCLYSKYANEMFVELNQWLRYGVSRGNYMFESLIGSTLSIMIARYNLDTTITDLDQMVQFTKDSLYYLNAQNTKLLRGDGEYKGCVGENAELDRLNVQPDCIDQRGEQFHDSYRCSSIDQSISIFTSLAKEIINSPAEKNFNANSTFYHLFHIANVHLADKLFKCAEVLASLAQQKISEYHVVLNAITWSSIIVAIIVFVTFNIIILRIDTAYKGLIQVMRRLPPKAMTSNTLLFNYVTNKDSSKKTENMSVSMSVIHLSKNPVVFVSKARTIDAVNDAVSDLLGFTNDQLLGQSITTLIPEEKAEEMYNAMSLMENGQCALTIDKSISAITDNELYVPVHVNILGIASGNSNEAKSFALILRDETVLLQQQKEAQEAKEQSEKLLFQILPRDIVTRLNANETDISFVVPNASIIFIDIVKFSDYSSALSPSQIMESLSTIFAAFDSECSAFDSITKIKLIGDVYMAAAGLFNHDIKPSVHASQTVQFGLKAIEVLEDLNTQLEANLKVRIGVNTDGPLIAGVLGTDKPTFDIIGDPINVSSRLQSTCVPGCVQISQTTYEAIQGMPFNIESRGEIELKGKGKKKAYIVRPVSISSVLL